MRKLFTAMRKAPKRASAVLTMIAAAVILPTALLAWGPDRPVYTIEEPADHVVFNSIKNNPAHGDERNFMQVREATASNTTYADSIALSAGKEYVVYTYFHNNAGSSLNASGVGIATGAYTKAQIPAIVPNGSAGTKAVGYVGASNASPSEVWDDISFSNATGGDIALRYVPGSATIHSFGAVDGQTMSDSIVTTGAPLGYNALDGKVPGCNEYAGYVTFRVKADQPNFEVTKQVRKLGEDSTKWRESANVNPGDKVEYLIHYKNTGTTQQNDVVVKDQLPQGVSYVAGTTKVKNALNPNGKAISDNVVTATGVNISNYTPGSDAYVWFTAKVAAKEQLACGTNTLVNSAKVETNNGSKNDTANVVVTGETCAPAKITVCELATKKIITIDETAFDSNKHSKNIADCAAPGEITVCDLTTKKLININENAFDASKHSKNLNDCATPSELPTTGPTETALSILGLGSLITAAGYYLNSRRTIIGRQ